MESESHFLFIHLSLISSSDWQEVLLLGLSIQGLKQDACSSDCRRLYQQGQGLAH